MNDINDFLAQEFYNIFGRHPQRRDELRIRQLYDSYGGQGGKAVLFEMIHKYYVELKIDAGIYHLKKEMDSHIEKQSLRHREHVSKAIADLAPLRDTLILLACGIFIVGFMAGVCIMMVGQ
ncbi:MULTISPECIES: hypothetical protein [unclassified Sphingobium]|uniref:hypothetical protein n=1 Tax=unclassified Sphingobium TaxID=2611147 RepID=UPI002225960D|nr:MULTISPECIES: hypothetical protein [unclassified Sphingobium]MCW2411806.1 hypothetical protein [Sphingobium sp. B8D3D]MCW2415896.1 hypothetical protein [Sphingobium sp. B8D3A]